MENLDHGNNKSFSLSLIAEYGASDSDSESIRNDNVYNDDDDTSKLSDMVLKNNIINACAHGPLARSRDDEETTRHMIIDSSESGVVEYEVADYRDTDSDSPSSSASDSSSDVDSVKDVEELTSGDEVDVNKSGTAEAPKVQGELGLEDLPPIEDLAISLPAQKTSKIGVITSVVDRLVIVCAIPNSPAIDLDSVLFLDNGAKTLGKVFDVFGPVTEPHYCVRFNSPEHVKERGVVVGSDVFAALCSHHTSYVFLSELMKLKGSDASWLNDIEPPPQHIEYSDDEEERRANKQKKETHKQNKQENADNGETSKNQGRKDIKKNQRPSESSSRFGIGRGANPFSGLYKRQPQPTVRLNMGYRRAHPQMTAPMTAPPSYSIPPPIFPPPFNPRTPPPTGMEYQINDTRIMFPRGAPPMFRNRFVFNPNFCNGSGPQPNIWVNNGPPPPPGT